MTPGWRELCLSHASTLMPLLSQGHATGLMDIWIHGVLTRHRVASPCFHIATGLMTATTATHRHAWKIRTGRTWQTFP
jgi:hypothetical protein